jgi:UDP-GlcNAc:undecaprenyl-phosphate GlcNAc-1-phosphate transferase
MSDERPDPIHSSLITHHSSLRAGVSSLRVTEQLIALSLLLIASSLTSFAATAIVKRAAESIGLVDRPNERKLHPEATPRIGGLAIIFGFGFPLLLLAGNSHAAELVAKNSSYLFAVLASGSLVVGLGVYDDLVGANATKKFIVQFAAAIIVVSYGFQFRNVSIAGFEIKLHFLGTLASIIWIVGVINAVNFIDGIDSLATVLSITIAISFAIIAIVRRDVFSLVIMTALLGSLIGFYPWNRPPAKIFMGDTGSLFIGLVLATCAIVKPSKSPTAIIIGGPMLALALPVIDTLIVMKQRFGGKQRSIAERFATMFNADRRHIHHILVERFGSTGKAIASIWFVTLVFAVAAVLTAVDSMKMIGYSVGAAGLVLLLILRYWHRPPPPTASNETPQGVVEA